MVHLRRAIVHGLRWMLRQPLVSLTSALCLSVGVAACATGWTLIDAAILRPYGLVSANRLLVVWEADLTRNQPLIEVSYLNFLDQRRKVGVLEVLARRAASASNDNVRAELTSIVQRLEQQHAPGGAAAGAPLRLLTRALALGAVLGLLLSPLTLSLAASIGVSAHGGMALPLAAALTLVFATAALAVVLSLFRATQCSPAELLRDAQRA